MPQTKDTLIVRTDTDEFTMVGRPCELSSFSFVPTERHNPKERTYFNSEKTDRYSHSTYDRLFHMDFGYSNKLHRCDREHANSNGLTVNDEEKTKAVPTLASSIYGHHLDREIDPPNRKHVRVGYVKKEFFRRSIYNITKECADSIEGAQG